MNATANSDRRFWREFFDLYRSLPETWDTRNPGYQNRELKSYGYRRLMIKLTEMQPTAEIDDLRKTIYTIRKEYQRQIRKLAKSRLFVPTLWCFEEITFLENAMPVDNLEPEDFYNIEEIFIDDDDNSPQKMEAFEEFIQENDECTALGNSWAALYRKLSPDQQIYASRTISEVLCQGQLGCLNSLSHKLFEWKPQSLQLGNKNPITPSNRSPSPTKNENSLNDDFDFNSFTADENADEDNSEDDEDKKPVNGADEYPVKYIVVDESEEMHQEMKYEVENCSVIDDIKCDDPISSIIEENTSFDDLIQAINASETMETIENTNDDVGSTKNVTKFGKEKNTSFEDLFQTINGSESMETVENINDDMESIENDTNIDKEKNSSQRKSKCAKLEALKKEHKNMLFCKSLLDAYENNPILWNTKLPENRSRSKRQLAMEKILECVSETCRELNISDVNVDYLKKKICVLRTGYKQELRNMIEKGINETSLWYFDQLTTMIGDIDNIEQQTTDHDENINNFELLDESEKYQMNIDLIEMYKSFPCLWDEKDPDYENKDVRETAREVIIEKMKEKWSIDLTPHTLHKKTLYIRALYARETQRRKDKLNSNATEGSSRPPSPPYLSELAELYFEKLSFLDYSTAKEYKCEYCPLSFCSEKKYKYHRYTHDGTHPYICGVCGKGFMRPANLQYHENTHLAAEDRPFACEYCCARFSHQVNRDVHMRRHTGQHVHRCNLCNKSFASSTEVKLHARSHTDEKPYICETCGKGFKSNGCFYHHRKKHLQQRDFKCKMCPKSFYRSYLLTAHMKSHLNIRDVICQVCQKAFTTQKSLTQHMKLHDEVKKYACRICNKTYAQASGLNFHMKSH